MDGLYELFPIKNKFSITQFHSIWHRPLRDNENFSGETHNFAEFVCVHSGEVGIMADTSLYSLSKGQCVFHSPNEFHNIWSISHAPEVTVISFDLQGVPNVSNGVFNATAQELIELSNFYNSVMTILDAIEKEGATESSEYELSKLTKTLEILLTDILVPSRKEQRFYNGASANTFEQIVTVMRNALYDMPSKSELAKQVGISISHLGKVILRYTGHGAMEYFTLMKMQKALDLLKEGYGVKQTAYTLGYADPSYFSNVFKKHIGLSPTHFIKNSFHPHPNIKP